MSKNVNDDGGNAGGEGAGTNPGGEGGNAGAGGEGAGNANPGTVGAGSGGDASAELLAIRAELEKERRERAKLKSQIDDAKTARMKEQNQWKELAEQREREATEAREEAEKLKNSFLSEKKYSAVKAAAAALGIRPEAISDLEMLDLSDIQIETTSTGKINALGAEKFAENLKRLKPHWFAEKAAPNVNTTGNRVHDSSGTITPKMILDLEKEGRKSGDMSKYHEAYKKFQQQRLAAARR